jgi:unsaturated chondroitin disaccharide hydrolase
MSLDSAPSAFDELVDHGIERMLRRVDETSSQVTAFPHWADPNDGRWVQTVDGDWTGGAWVGQLWLALRLTGDEKYRTLARRWCEALWPRLEVDSVYRAFTVYYGGALGSVVAKDSRARELALEGAARLAAMFDDRLGLIPLGDEAEEGNAIGAAESAIDSLEASALLLWAAEDSADQRLLDIASKHTTRVLDLHVHPDGSIGQSTSLNADGSVLKHHTHKGYGPSSIWARAQAWGMIFSTIAYIRVPAESAWLDHAVRATDWWIDHVPEDLVAPWDFDDPKALSDGHRDTSATAIAASAMLKLAEVVPDDAVSAHYRATAERTVASLLSDYLTPVASDDERPTGMLIGGCFTLRPDTRAEDAVADAELIFGSYYLLECLAVLSGAIKETDV